MRHAQVAGQFYYSNREELKKHIETLLSSLDVSSVRTKESKQIRAAIVPHAGYLFSGKCAAFVYTLLKKEKFDTFLILGTNHSGLGSKISLSIEDFETPLGVCESDILLIEKLIKDCEKIKLDVTVDENSHKYEHSIEVQLPFLQQVQKDFKIVACLVRDLRLEETKKLGKIISSIINSEKNKKIFILASSDFTHYGQNYGFIPFKENIRKNLYELDNKAIEKILNLETKEFMQQAEKTTICGKIPIACCTEIAKNLKLTGEKICYYTSGDVSGDWRAAVGYAGIVFS